MEASNIQCPFLDIIIIKEGKRFLWIVIQNQRTQTDTFPSNQATPSILEKNPILCTL